VQALEYTEEPKSSLEERALRLRATALADVKALLADKRSLLDEVEACGRVRFLLARLTLQLTAALVEKRTLNFADLVLVAKEPARQFLTGEKQRVLTVAAGLVFRLPAPPPAPVGPTSGMDKA